MPFHRFVVVLITAALFIGAVLAVGAAEAHHANDRLSGVEKLQRSLACVLLIRPEERTRQNVIACGLTPP